MKNIKLLQRHLELMDRLPFCKKTEYIVKELSMDFPNKRIGSGSSRLVYDLIGTKYVLKIAYNGKGVAQNKAESHPIFKEYSKYFSQIILESKRFHVLVSEKAEHISCALQLEDRLIKDRLSAPMYIIFKPKEQLPPWRKIYKKNLTPFGNRLREVLFNINKEIPLFLPGDFIYLDSYGLVNNKLKIIDYGFNQEVYEKHYRRY